MPDRDCSTELAERVTACLENKTPLQITGGHSKSFYGNPTQGEVISVLGHCGIVRYEPTELVLTARCGTPLALIEQTLADNQQMLAFEPPHFGPAATLGGCIATGLSGPRRPYSGAARDFVLGARLINGKGEILHFGGEVMKNVAGYDVARLLTGSLGTLGIMLEVSLKVLPKPEVEHTQTLELTEQTAIHRINELSGQAYPISAACFDGDRLYVRLSGNAAAVKAAQKQIGGETLTSTSQFWQSLREQTHAFFQSKQPLWRLSLAAAAPPLECSGKQLIEWGGAQRWLMTEAEPQRIRNELAKLGGHATLFRHSGEVPVFHPLTGKLRELQMNIKLAFDPYCLFNRGRLYPEF